MMGPKLRGNGNRERFIILKKERKGEQKYEVTEEERHIREEREVK